MGRTPKPWYRRGRDAWFVTLDGRQIRLAEGKDGKKAAAEEFHRLMADREAARARPPGIALAAICDLFVEHLEREKSPLHARTTRDRLRRFVRHVGARTDAALVRPHHVTAWFATRAWGPTTRHGYVTTIKSLFNWARK